MGVNLKKKVKDRMAITGESYQEALRAVRQGRPLPPLVAFEVTGVDVQEGVITASTVRR